MKLKDVPVDWIDCGDGLWRKPIEYRQRDKIYKSTKKYYERRCLNCGEIFLADSLNKTARFCGLSCGVSGKFHPRWRGGKQKYGGYIYIWQPGHPNANGRGYVAEHTLVITEHLGRPLKPNEQVHHINGDKEDNKLENLIALTINKHRKLHEELKRNSLW